MSRRQTVVELGSILLGLTMLLLRTPGPAAIPLAVGAGALGGAAPVYLNRTFLSRTRWLVATAIGLVAVFFVSRVAPPEQTSRSVITLGALVVAAIAEELLFRRLVYGWLLKWGVGMAIVVSAVAFALIHLPAYGLETVGINFAVGLLFGWQRHHSGTWTAPAVTHVAANLLATL
jgi:membrane protease YdiL (CAAX protease family)